jgi:hypothetical protein
MVLVVTIVLIAMAAVVAFVAVLVREGFRNGDLGDDVRVGTRTVAALDAGATGKWVEVTVTNPSAATALLALALRRPRFPRLSPAVERRTGGRRVRLSLADQVLGTVPPGEDRRFWVWAEGDHRRLRLEAAVGTPGRLRLHRVPLARPERFARRGWPTTVVDPRARVP